MSPDDIRALDRADPLTGMRESFLLPPGRVYLNGNSLGPLPRAAQARLREVVDTQWGVDLISSWNSHGWIDLPRTAGEKIAPLIGAAPGQVVCCDSVSVNLFKLLAAALNLQAGRHVVLSQKDNFPTDLYVAQGLSQLLGEGGCQLRAVDASQLMASLIDDVAVLTLTQVNFRSGSLHDIAALTQAAHDRGILVVWDLSHSAGVVPLALDDWGVDFAVGCGYKFLNGGPGAPAFIYANRKHHGNLQQPLQGWMGHAAPFDFNPEYIPAPGVEQFLTGTPNILSLVSLDAALDAFDGVSMTAVRDKSVSLSETFSTLVAAEPALGVLSLQSPTASELRGSQLAYAHPQAYAINRALHAEGIIVDFRSPDLLRFGFSPLFLSHADIARSVEALVRVIAGELYNNPQYQQRLKVT